MVDGEWLVLGAKLDNHRDSLGVSEQLMVRAEVGWFTTASQPQVGSQPAYSWLGTYLVGRKQESENHGQMGLSTLQFEVLWLLVKVDS